LHRQPVSMSCVCQRLMEFLSGGSTSNCRRKLRWTVITDVVFEYSTAQNAFCCLVGAILNILCPRERRVFQSKLGVSSNNQCNLHHSPHTGHLEKKIKKGYNFFRTRCIYAGLLEWTVRRKFEKWNFCLLRHISCIDMSAFFFSLLLAVSAMEQC